MLGLHSAALKRRALTTFHGLRGALKIALRLIVLTTLVLSTIALMKVALMRSGRMMIALERISLTTLRLIVLITLALAEITLTQTAEEGINGLNLICSVFQCRHNSRVAANFVPDEMPEGQFPPVTFSANRLQVTDLTPCPFSHRVPTLSTKARHYAPRVNLKNGNFRP